MRKAIGCSAILGLVLLVHNRSGTDATKNKSIPQGIHNREVWITKSMDDGVAWSKATETAIARSHRVPRRSARVRAAFL
jgi:hypothetical protein